MNDAEHISNARSLVVLVDDNVGRNNFDADMRP